MFYKLRIRCNTLQMLLLPFVLLLWCVPSVTHAADQGARVVVLVANHLQLSDLESAGPNLRALVSESGLALVNTGMKRSTGGRYLAMGAGTRLQGPDGSPVFLDKDEFVNPAMTDGTVGDVYDFQMGKRPAGSIVCVGFPRLVRANKEHSPKNERLGLIGDVFHQYGLRTAAIGNSDTPKESIRGVPLIVMDGKGVIDAGTVGRSMVEVDPGNPSGLRDNLSAITALTAKLMLDNALVAVELGDFNRIEAFRYRMSDSAYKMYRSINLQELDTFVGDLRRQVDRRGSTLIICSPERARAHGYYSDLAPMLLYRRGGTKGLLTSASTRCIGLINNTDVGPTILRYADLQVPKSILGQPVRVVPVPDNYDRLMRMEMIASRNYALQTPVLAIVGALALIIITLSQMSIRWGKSRRGLRKFFGIVLLGAVSMPAAFLLIDGLGTAGIAGYLGRFISAVVLLSAVSYGFGALIIRSGEGRESAAIGVVLILTTLLLAVDSLCGSPLLRWSILSCDHITGIRFYGIGNEYMGVMIGSALLGPVLLLRLKRSGAEAWTRLSGFMAGALLIWFAFVTFVVGYPGLGANVGGLITAVVTFGVALAIGTGTKFKRKHIVWITAIVIIATAVFASIDLFGSGEQGSHLARTLSLVSLYGWGYIVNLVVGKLGMHLGILKLRQAYLPVLGSIPFLFLYRNSLKYETPSIKSSDILYRVGMPATLAGVVVAFLFNDSGIVPAALMLALFMISVLHLRLQGAQSCE